MGRPKGLPKTGGRRKGSPNKITTDLRAAIMGAFDKVGGVDYLARVAKDQPQVFCPLLGKVLPTALAGADGEGPLIIRWKTDARAESETDNRQANGKDHTGSGNGVHPVDRSN